jgi:hypothetical protein
MLLRHRCVGREWAVRPNGNGEKRRGCADGENNLKIKNEE